MGSRACANPQFILPGVRETALLVSAWARQQVANRYLWRFVVVEDLRDLVRDGHFDLMLTGEALRGPCGADAFRYFAVE